MTRKVSGPLTVVPNLAATQPDDHSRMNAGSASRSNFMRVPKANRPPRLPGRPALFDQRTGLVHRVLQALAGLELRLLGGRDVDLLAGARVAALGGGTLGDMKRAEADQTDFLILLQRAGDGIEHRID